MRPMFLSFTILASKDEKLKYNHEAAHVKDVYQ